MCWGLKFLSSGNSMLFFWKPLPKMLAMSLLLQYLHCWLLTIQWIAVWLSQWTCKTSQSGGLFSQCIRINPGGPLLRTKPNGYCLYCHWHASSGALWKIVYYPKKQFGSYFKLISCFIYVTDVFISNKYCEFTHPHVWLKLVSMFYHWPICWLDMAWLW